MILMSSKDFNIYNRIYFLIKEYERISNMHNAISTIKDKSVEYFNNFVLNLMKESSLSLNKDYECYSDEIISMISKIEVINEENYCRLSSNGWEGEILVVGKKNTILETKNIMINYYESVQNMDNNLVNMWCSDDMNNYCDWSFVGGMITLMNPQYEDFMI